MIFELLEVITFKRQPQKIVKHIQTIRRVLPTNCFECVWPFCGVGSLKCDKIWTNFYIYGNIFD